jgi:nuclear pore complex protein Nup188
MLATWKTLWEHNPPLLACVLRFLNIVWQHGLEHKSALEKIREDTGFWSQLADIIQTELGPAPSYEVDSYVDLDGVRRALLHMGVSSGRTERLQSPLRCISSVWTLGCPYPTVRNQT